MTDHSMVMPFVTVTSKGGPHDDDSYVAGYEMGLLDARLSALGAWVSDAIFTLRAENMPQVDLLAMRYGFVVTNLADAIEVDGWCTVKLVRI